MPGQGARCFGARRAPAYSTQVDVRVGRPVGVRYNTLSFVARGACVRACHAGVPACLIQTCRCGAQSGCRAVAASGSGSDAGQFESLPVGFNRRPR
eukprot:229099-Chlamydomonas_euryale.AAC.1